MNIPFKGMMQGLKRGVSDNSPSILTGAGVAGVVTTSVLTGIAMYRLSTIVTEDGVISAYDGMEPTPVKDILKENWKLFIPPVLSAALTITSIIGSNRIMSRRSAALAGLYSLTDTAFREYQAKVVEKMGEKKELTVRDEIVADKVAKTEAPDRSIMVVGSENVLCYDAFTGRYFASTVEKLRKAENDVNYTCINDMYASLNSFYSALDIPTVNIGDDLGWSTSNPLELHFTSGLNEKNDPYLAVTFKTAPTKEFANIW